MKALLLLRHAKSSWDDPALADFDRPLAKRGIEAAGRMGREIARRGWVPDHAQVSAARRTRDTWRIAADAWPALPSSDMRDDIYEATPEAILAAIREAPETAETLLMIGHNPGLEDLSVLLAAADSQSRPLARLREKFPTGALARFEFTGRWRDLAPGAGRLTHFLAPKTLPPEV